MHFRLFFAVLVMALAGCGGNNSQNPTTPYDASTNRGLALYAMTFHSSIIQHSGDRVGQSDHAYIESVVPGDLPPEFNGGNFTLNAELIDYDREKNFLTVEFTVDNENSMPVYDPRLVFFFDYVDSTGVMNEPIDPYRLLSPDLDQNCIPDVDLVMSNIDQSGTYILGGDMDDFSPAVRLMRFQDDEVSPPFPLVKDIPRSVTVLIHIPNENDPEFENYEPIRWNILLEGTLQGQWDNFPPHEDAVDIKNQRLPSYLEQEEEGISRTLTCTLRLPRFTLAEDVSDEWSVSAYLDGIDDYIGWEPMIFDQDNVNGYEMHYTIGPISGDNFSAENSPYVIRIKAVSNQTNWIIADDAYAYVVPAQTGSYELGEKNAGHYWVVYLEEHPLSRRYEFKAMNTVRQTAFWLSGPDNAAVDDSILENYTNFQHVSMARLGGFEPGGGGEPNQYRLVFEAQKAFSAAISSMPNIDILGLTINFDLLPEAAGEFIVLADEQYLYASNWYESIEREPCISPDGFYVVYEKEERFNDNGDEYDRTRSYVQSFDIDDSVTSVYPADEIWSPNPSPSDERYTCTEPTIGSVFGSEYTYVIGYATDVDLDDDWTCGRGLIGITKMIPVDGGIPTYTVGTQFEYTSPEGVTSFYLHSPSIAPDASYISFCASEGGFTSVLGAVLDLVNLNLEEEAQYEQGALFQYNPSVSGQITTVNGEDWGSSNRACYRAGNNKNGDVRLYFSESAEVPAGLTQLITITDTDTGELSDDYWRDDRGHDSCMDISTDGCAMVWTSSRFSGGDVIFLDLRDLSNNGVNNISVIRKLIRVSTTGKVFEPQISDFIPMGEL